MSVWGISELFVGNLAPETTDDDVQTLFKGYGGVVEAWVGKKGKTGPGSISFGVVRYDYPSSQCRCVCCATLSSVMRRMSSHAEALVAKKNLHGTTFKGKTISVRWYSFNLDLAHPKPARLSDTRLLFRAENQRALWVGSLASHVTNEVPYLTFASRNSNVI
jgi:hypothetical protein